MNINEGLCQKKWKLEGHMKFDILNKTNFEFHEH